ncbi:MAG: 30S ribosomal protein S3 [Candidatus Pacearchaeota archaeon]
MEEKKFITLKKDEYGIKEYIKKSLGKGRFSSISVEYTPIGEKIIISTTKPGFIIGKKGEKINELTNNLKKIFKLENPIIEIREIQKPEFDAVTIADEIALSLERLGSSKFKLIAYKTLEKIQKAGALGAEIRLSGKLPSARAKSWRFAFGYLKKTGDTVKVVKKAKATAQTIAGTIGIKVSILPPNEKIHDQILINEEIKRKIEENINRINIKEKEEKNKKSKK